MRKVFAITLAVGGLAVGSWMLWNFLRDGDRRSDRVARPLTAPANHDRLNTGESPEPPPAAPPVQSSSPAIQKLSDQTEWQHIEELLAQPGHCPLMKDVPRLSPESEARLVQLYHQIGDITNKEHIVFMLAFGGGSAAAKALIHAVTAEYSGQRVSAKGSAILLYIPELLGVLARHNEDAFRFLLNAARREFWLERILWRGQDGEEESLCALVARCIEGLALSGRQEAQELINWYWAHPEEAGFPERDGKLNSFAGALPGAVFRMAIINEIGLERAMDEVFYDPEYTLKRYSQWRRTTAEGEKWFDWYLRSAEAVPAKYRNRTQDIHR